MGAMMWVWRAEDNLWDLGLSYDTGSRDWTQALRLGSKRLDCWVISTSPMAAVFIHQRDSFADILFRACIHALKCTFLSVYCSCFSFPLCCGLNLLGRWSTKELYNSPETFFSLLSQGHISQACVNLNALWEGDLDFLIPPTLLSSQVETTDMNY